MTVFYRLKNEYILMTSCKIMKKFFVLSIVLGVIGRSSLFLKDSTTDTDLSSKDTQHEQVAKAPVKYTPYIIWFIG